MSTDPSALATALFAPDAIALVGASPDALTLASRPMRVLRKHGYAGRIFPVNPACVAMDELPCFAGLAEIPHRIAHALLMMPATGVVQAIEECAAAGIKVATVLTAGFAELGSAGKRRQDALVATGLRTGVRILGPNSLGVVNVNANMVLSANAVFEQEVLRPGGLSVISQSGSMLGAIVTRAQQRGMNFSKLISVGNECDLGIGELVDLLVDDVDTKAILLFLETLRDSQRLARAARRAFAAGKPVIAYKLGRTRATRDLAMTHTGATTGGADASRAFFRDHGILHVEIFDALFETANFVLGHRPSLRHRLAAVTVSGGGAAMVLDNLPSTAVDIVAPTDEVIAKLKAAQVRISPDAVIDLPMGRADHGAYAKVVRALMESAHCDMVLAVQGSNATYLPESVHERVLAAGPPLKPLAVFLAPRAESAGCILQSHGVAAFGSPEACADAIRAYCTWRAPVQFPHVHEAMRARIETAARHSGNSNLNESDAYRLLSSLGIPCAPTQILQSATEEITIAFPVAAKILSSDIAHKSDVEGVLLDIESPAALRDHVDTLMRRLKHLAPGVRCEGVLVQTMQRGVAEVLIGFKRDPEVGAIVVLGLGGTHADLNRERVVRCAPLGIEEAISMVESLPAVALLRGHRTRPGGDLQALARAIHAMSLLALAAQPHVLEAEINPLIVQTNGVVAVDALVRLDPTTQ